MNALVLVLINYDTHSGVGKKIQYQAQALQCNGFEKVFIGVLDNDLSLSINDIYIGKKARFLHLTGQLDFYRSLFKYIKSNEISFVYFRYTAMTSDPWLVLFFYKLKVNGIKCVMEIPTYPFEGEIKQRTKLYWLDRLTHDSLAKQMNYIITFSGYTKIFGKNTIQISNGISYTKTPVRTPIAHTGFNIIAVANLMYWHGIDRMINGIIEYSRSQSRHHSNQKVHLHIVCGKDTEYILKLKELVSSNNLSHCITFHGEVYGDKLDYLFDICDVAIGSLGRHRNGIKELKTLKNVEYAVRGIPFVYSENNPDFDGEDYVMKVPMDDSPVDVNSIIKFVHSLAYKPEEIRSFNSSFDWNTQMKHVIDKIYTDELHKNS